MSPEMKIRAGFTSLIVVLAAVIMPLALTSTPAQAVATYRVLITGDSITQGSSGDYTWRYRLWNKLLSTAPGDVTFVGTRTDLYDNVNDTFGSQYYAASFAAKSHAAKWGDAYTAELPNIASQVTSSDANVLVAMLGSNDLAYQTSPTQTIANLETYIARARNARPGIDIVVGEVVNRWDPWSQSYSLNSETAAYASLLATTASSLNTTNERVVIAPTRTGWDARVHTWDGTHPNPTGEALIAQRVSQALTSIGVGTAGPDISGPKSWGVTGSGVSLTPGSEQIAIGWNRTPSGATGMFIEQRLTNINGTWERLPYAVSGGGWTAGLLAAGGTYQYRVVPSKGSSTGVAGTAATATAGGPMPSDLNSVSVSPGVDSINGGKTAYANWSSSSNATGYLLSSRVMSNGATSWADLPYPISDTNWVFDMNYPGRYYQYRVKPVRGFLSPGWKASSSVRMRGLPGDRVYIALGDSYSSGLGAVQNSQYTGGSCRRTTQAWPWMVQTGFQYLTSHIACAGATRQDVYGTQIGSMNSTFSAYAGKPQLISMTVGGNDVGFAEVAKDCVIGSGSCLYHEAPTNTSIDNLEPALRGLYSSLKSAQPYADIVVGGYPVVVEPGEAGGFPDTCDLFGNNERDMVQRLVSRLNARINSAASDAGVWSAASRVQNRFVGHGACTSGEWIHGPMYEASGGPDDPNSFHPNAGGQLAYSIAFSDTLIDRAG